MRVKAPGKVVLSGAYAVLEGAPSLVTAVNRYVIADTERLAVFEPPEARAAIPTGPLPFVDVTQTRMGGRKLGIGSSAAVVVASLAARVCKEHPHLETKEIAEQVWKPAVLAHRKAQGGGSGIDVVTSAWGGTLRCVVHNELPHAIDHALPSGLAIRLFAAPNSASTPQLLAQVQAWAARHPAAYRQLMTKLCHASEQTATASQTLTFVHSIAKQSKWLAQLGDESGAPIVPSSLRDLGKEALQQNVAIHPSGAGGGDIVLCVGSATDCNPWARALEAEGYLHLPVSVGAQGVHVAEEGEE